MNQRMILLLYLLHLASTLFMVGVIWFVQVVHYPLFAKIGTMEFPGYEQTHTSLDRTGGRVPMLLELFTALLLLRFRPPGV